MPIYEYTCSACKARFEKLVKSMSREGDGGRTTKVACPECGSTTTARSMSVFSVSSTAGAGGKSSGPSESTPGLCGRCGGPGPCASGY